MVLFGITEKNIEETRDFEEYRVTIDIESKTIDFDVLHEYSLEDLKEDYEEEELNFQEIDRDFKNIAFEDVFELKAFIDKSNYNDQYLFYNAKDNKYIGLVQ